MKLVCKTCGKWFQINRKIKEDNKTYLLAHICGESFRSISEVKSISPSTAYRRYYKALKSLPHCADITRKYCSRFCGILLVDGKYVKIKGYDKKIPVIYGIDYLTHDIPTYRLASSENYQALKKFFTSLRLLNYPLQSLVCDDNYNTLASYSSVYPNAATQLCQNHYKENIRLTLNMRTDDTYKRFMYEIVSLFKKKRSLPEFNGIATKLYRKYEDDFVAKSILLDIQKRSEQLLAYTKVPKTPRTTNLIESFNSHLQGRLKTVKGFESFEHANNWLNAYFVRRRLKKFTSCNKKFKYLNGKSSLQMTISNHHIIEDVLKLIR